MLCMLSGKQLSYQELSSSSAPMRLNGAQQDRVIKIGDPLPYCGIKLQGADCSGQWMYAGDNSVNCYSNCSDAGVCKSGWCHCEPGRWGLDCSRTRVRSAAANCDAEL